MRYSGPANEAQDSVRPSSEWKRARGRPPTTWIRQIHRDTGIPVTDALELTDHTDDKLQRRDATVEHFTP